jgi:hypothetical protein
MKGQKIKWTEEMVQKLISDFPNRITIDIAKEIGVSLRTAIRKARELGIEKKEGFLDEFRTEITKRAQNNKAPNPNKGNKDFRIPGGENFQFQPGHKPINQNYELIRQKRNETIKREKLRLKYGLRQETKLKLVNYY